MRLYVLRHGETAWSRDRRHTGVSDIPLTPAGRRQARAAGGYLERLRGPAPWSLALTSPLVRASHTAQLAGIDAQADDRLREWDYGRYDGVTTDEILAGRPGWDLWRDGGPGGEQPADVQRRVDALLAERVAPALRAGDVLLVAHSHLLRALAARWLGLRIDGGRLLVLGPAALGVLGHDHQAPALLGWNLRPTPRPRGQQPP